MCKIQTPFEIEPFENPPLPKAREQLIKLAHLNQRWGAGALLCAKVQKTFSRAEEVPKFSFTEFRSWVGFDARPMRGIYT